MKRFLRRLRGAVGNATVWGTAWFGWTLALFTTEELFGGLASPFPWLFILKLATIIGVTGSLTGGAFSAFLGFAYRDRSLLEIKVRRFALGGAIIAGLFSPVVAVIAGTLTGTGLASGNLIGVGAMAALLGGVTAGGTIKLAQRAARKLSEAAVDELETEQDEVLALLRDQAV